MSRTFAIGDIHGCYRPLMMLLEKLQFNEKSDNLWFTGDFVNRGPDALAVLRFISSLSQPARVVLGNHDLHFLAVYFKQRQLHPKFDHFDELFAAHDIDVLVDWLCQQPLAVYQPSLNALLTHAGICPAWTVSQTLAYADEVAQALQDEKTRALFFKSMYGNEPSLWSEDLEGMDRLRCITNYLTRMRYLDKTTHRLLLQHKTLTTDAQAVPWFDCLLEDSSRPLLLFGHWAALQGKVSRADVIGLDTGCYYGGVLTALDLDSLARIQINGF